MYDSLAESAPEDALDALVARVGVVPLPEPLTAPEDLPPSIEPHAGGPGSVASLINPSKSTGENVTNLLEASALFSATALPILVQRLIMMAQTTDDIEELRKAVATVQDNAQVFEKRKTSVAAQAPLTIIFERAAPKDGFVVDVRSGAKMAALRAASADAEDA